MSAAASLRGRHQQQPADTIGAAVGRQTLHVPQHVTDRDSVPAADGRQQAVIVGAGPAGTLIAMLLARQGFSVRVLEKRPDPTEADVTKETFIMGLTLRSSEPMKQLGVALPEIGAESGWLGDIASHIGIGVHFPDGRQQMVPQPKTNFTAERAALAQHLLTEARRLYPDIRFDFGADIQAIDLGSRSLTLAAPEQAALQYDLLVAADGVSSQVRGALEAQDPSFSAERLQSPLRWVTARGLPPPADCCLGTEEDAQQRSGRSITFFLAKAPNGLQQPITMFLAYKHHDGTYSALLQFVKGWQPPAAAAQLEPFLRAAFPQLPKDWIQPAAQQAAGSEPRSWGSTVTCSRLTSPAHGVLLIGDAAHGVTPTLGQGCNSALESADVAAKVLAEHPDDLELALETFDRVRKPDVRALTYMDKLAQRLIGRGGKGPPSRNPVALISWYWPWLATQANLRVSGFMHRLAPALWDPPFQLLISSSTIPYRRAMHRRDRDLILLAAVGATSVAAAVKVAAWALRLL